MSLWTDRELKALIARVNVLEKRIEELEKKPRFDAENLDFPQPQIDKRTKEYKQWKNANS